jgi:hypothetical protein
MVNEIITAFLGPLPLSRRPKSKPVTPLGDALFSCTDQLTGCRAAPSSSKELPACGVSAGGGSPHFDGTRIWIAASGVRRPPSGRKCGSWSGACYVVRTPPSARNDLPRKVKPPAPRSARLARRRLTTAPWSTRSRRDTRTAPWSTRGAGGLVGHAFRAAAQGAGDVAASLAFGQCLPLVV